MLILFSFLRGVFQLEQQCEDITGKEWVSSVGPTAFSQKVFFNSDRRVSLVGVSKHSLSSTAPQMPLALCKIGSGVQKHSLSLRLWIPHL